MTQLEQENTQLMEQLEISWSKTKALEVFSSELQIKHDNLNIKFRENMTTLNDLTKKELPSQVMDFK